MAEIHINVNIDNRKDLINIYNRNIINPNLGNYLFDELKGKSLNSSVTINIITNIYFSDDERVDITNMIKNNFAYIDNEDSIMQRIVSYRSIILLIFGTIFIWISYYLDIINNYMFKELPLILGWVAIWEVADYLFFDRTKYHIKRKRLKQLRNAKIVFKEIKWKNI